MKAKFNALIQLCFTFSIPQKFVSLPFNASHIKTPFAKPNLWWTGAAFTTTTMVSPSTGTLEDNHSRNALEDTGDRPKDSIDVFRRWGCSETDISKIFLRRPTLRATDLTDLQSKLSILGKLGLSASDLVKIINCRPRFLNCCINHCFDERLEYLQALFGSKKILLKAITRNPSLLVYDFHNTIKPIIATYERMGVSRNDLIPMLLSRPTLISRSSFTDEKMYYIQKIGLSKDSKMYKYVVTLIAISRLETIREKVANFEKCGFSEDEVWGLLRRAPMVLTLSIDKVQRNMTFVLGTMKLPASTVIGFPSLLYSNLETVLKPRVLLARKIKDMGLVPQFKGCPILGPVSMKENRFVEAFIECHSKDVASELMEYYTNVKDVKRLAETSKRNLIKGFPF
ncbi:transcription termination factor MTERF9, chloroplastic-like [Cornus florida]|uniref:transcription termination factor MTERF9, chloroplastic-like n=1 Tax=Cornus florida TaxID=4283 RepID=UPI002898FC1C|nr:transcription termination factor MTERF9, chloroplastic-like [Cornus florida]XP_059666700.1 transcription termination factor MTERF9, chloroplastic-like [Cornus florida]XP_059666701.1 transcription termination factor MTERF9, chloroplastic-like [Cornus florida]XP_059666702.1 transcription termination factor MTERF9, chloroplastic-like [Cornus florida]XP_059666704.1 transcription termination factor MTERF9, chloroplastic-like [Cornus florida]XP_059666705.1 transcription termination factor MTERF9,